MKIQAGFFISKRTCRTKPYRIGRSIFFKIVFFQIISCLLLSVHSFSQGIWTQKASFPGTQRYDAIGFSIDTKGYIGTGYDISGSSKQDFWEWDQATNVWTQKADFGGMPRGIAVSFAIGAKGYVGTGFDGTTYYDDFWEWDQATNVWTQKANFSGIARGGAISFSIGTKGYIGTGVDISSSYNLDFWEWDQATNAWTQKANFAAGVRAFAVGFSINTKGYIGTGTGSLGGTQDFWEWDQATNTWLQKNNFPGPVRWEAAGMSIGTKGYIGTGVNFNLGTTYQDFWEWDQTTDTWIQKANFGGGSRLGIERSAFSIGCKGYFGTGTENILYNDFWEYYDPSNATCCNFSASISGDSTIYAGQSVTLSAGRGVTYLWSNGSTSQSITESPSQTTEYCVAITDVSNCTDTACITVLVEPCSEFYLPNAFSPNGDGENDELKIYYENSICIKSLHLIIYTRWGEKVYETMDAKANWDGTHKGETMNSSVFVYYMKTTLISGEEIAKKGNITLIR